MSSVSSIDYWSILSRIDLNYRSKIRGKEGVPVVNGSELAHVINLEVPYNPLRIMREASRIAQEAGIKGTEKWSMTNESANLCSLSDEINFCVYRRRDIGETDADKLAALEVLAQVCEYIKRSNH